MKINVLIIEDNFFIAEDIKRILLLNCDFEIFTAHNYEESIIISKEYPPDIIVSDINLEQQKTGIDAVNEIKTFSSPKIIYLTSFSDNEHVKEAMKTEMASYIVKPFSEEQLNTTVQIVYDLIIEKREKVSLIGIDELSNKELKILKLISEGKTSKEIATILFISPKTVENHRANISSKLLIPSAKNSLLQWVLKNKEHLI